MSLRAPPRGAETRQGRLSEVLRAGQERAASFEEARAATAQATDKYIWNVEKGVRLDETLSGSMLPLVPPPAGRRRP